MRRLLPASLLLALGACRQHPAEQPAPEYADWYALRAPEAREIKGVYGDIDGTLVITTGPRIYRTTDRGKTWQPSAAPVGQGIFTFAARHDTLLALTTQRGSLVDSSTTFARQPTYYSADQGRTWQAISYPLPPQVREIQVPLNRVRTPSGGVYRIALAQQQGYLVYEGIRPDGGALLKLPQEHEINSIYLDSKARLYVAASAPLRGQRKDFAFCGEQNGLLYVSKQPLP